MTGIGEVASIAQLVSLAFGAFKGCIDAYRFIYDAQNLDRDGDFLCSKLFLEYVRLESWASRAGLDSTSPNPRLRWEVVVRILEAENKLVTQAETLREKYQLDDLEDQEAVDSVPSFGNRFADGKEKQTGTTGLLLSLKPRARSIASSSTRKPGPLKKIKWASFGKERTTKVVEEITKHNDALNELLDIASQNEIKDSLHTLLRDALSRCNDPYQIENIRGLLQPAGSRDRALLEAAAQFRTFRLRMEVKQSERKDAGFDDAEIDVRGFSEEKLVPSRSEAHGMALQLGTYDNNNYLIEWRVPREVPYKHLQESVAKLAVLLSTADNDYFHCLKCAGIFEGEEKRRIGLAFELPPQTFTKSGVMPESKSLLQLLSEQSVASLADRLRIAQSIAEAVLQLHTAGWLHKGIRSENVRFLGKSGDAQAAMLKSEPYLLGYQYSRQVEGPELTERPATELQADLYRHPEKRGSSRQAFKTRYDMYALGCLLTELALWKPLQDIFATHTGRNIASEIKLAEKGGGDLHMPSLTELMANKDFEQQLQHHVGPAFATSIDLCVNPPKASMDEDEAPLRVQNDVLSLLRSCRLDVSESQSDRSCSVRSSA